MDFFEGGQKSDRTIFGGSSFARQVYFFPVKQQQIIGSFWFLIPELGILFMGIDFVYHHKAVLLLKYRINIVFRYEAPIVIYDVFMVILRKYIIRI